MPIDLICLDADDTLWHNMRHFAEAEDSLLAMLQPFADARIARSALEQCEARNLNYMATAQRASPSRWLKRLWSLGAANCQLR
jgi:putative hydrolase of the HAD superfamily